MSGSVQGGKGCYVQDRMNGMVCLSRMAKWGDMFCQGRKMTWDAISKMKKRHRMFCLEWQKWHDMFVKDGMLLSRVPEMTWYAFVKGGINGMVCFVSGRRNGMGCFIKNCRNGMECFVKVDRNGIFFVKFGGKGIGCFVNGGTNCIKSIVCFDKCCRNGMG